MLPKLADRQKAIELRKKGKSYSEILSEVHVSQSSLSSWLKNILLTEEQMNLLLLKKKAGQKRGGLVKKKFRKFEEKQIIDTAGNEIKELSSREFWLLGIIAYWCEGSKQKEWNVSQGVIFANSDPFLIKLFANWVKKFCLVEDKDIKYNLYIHETGNTTTALDYWSKILNIHVKDFGKTSIKKHNILTKRKNIRQDYHGLIRISINRSTNLNRKIKGWVMGINALI